MKLASAVVIGGAASLCLRRALSDPGTSKPASAGGSPSGPSPVTPTSTTAPSTPPVTAVRRTRLDEGAAQAEVSGSEHPLLPVGPGMLCFPLMQQAQAYPEHPEHPQKADSELPPAQASPERPQAEPDEAKRTKPKGQISSTGMRRTKSDAGTLPSIFY
mmetsp:Transcript_5694/g.14441  ORF Transcript_5694/g.14441 Transcript_5694/m.14441 type:complete len:159 (-) Transcript_5694:681-1157(-)